MPPVRLVAQGAGDHFDSFPLGLRVVEGVERRLRKQLVLQLPQMLSFLLPVGCILPVHIEVRPEAAGCSGNFPHLCVLIGEFRAWESAMPSHVKTIAGAKEVVLEDGSAAMLVFFTDGDYTWWVAEGEKEIDAIKLRAGETIIISAEDPPEIYDVGTVH
jgi:hypothetical protein